jgi:hypothetical protein
VANAQGATVMRAQLGQVMSFVAVALAVVLVPVAAYAVDAVAVSAAEAVLQEATAAAATEAAQQVDTTALRAGRGISIDIVAARQVVRDVLAAEAPAASVRSMTVSGALVTVATDEPVRLPFGIFAARAVHLGAHASARLSGGYDKPSSRLPLPTSSF